MSTQRPKPTQQDADADFGDVTVISGPDSPAPPVALAPKEEKAPPVREETMLSNADKTQVGGNQDAMADVFDASTVVQMRPPRLTDQVIPVPPISVPPAPSRAAAVSPLKAAPPATASRTVPTPPPSSNKGDGGAMGLNSESKRNLLSDAPVPHRSGKTDGGGAKRIDGPATSRSEDEADSDALTGAHEAPSRGAMLAAQTKAFAGTAFGVLKTRSGILGCLVLAVILYAVFHGRGAEAPEPKSGQVESASLSKPIHKNGKAEGLENVPESAHSSGSTNAGGGNRSESILIEFDKAFSKTQGQR
jgi:hypothetical protein